MTTRESNINFHIPNLPATPKQPYKSFKSIGNVPKKRLEKVFTGKRLCLSPQEGSLS